MNEDTIELYSRDGSEYYISEEYDLVSDMIADSSEVGAEYYSAKFSKIKPASIINIDYILEQFDEYVYDVCNVECATPFTDASEESKKELEDFLTEWTNKNVTLSNYYEYVGPEVCHHITEEQMKECI